MNAKELIQKNKKEPPEMYGHNLVDSIEHSSRFELS